MLQNQYLNHLIHPSFLNGTGQGDNYTTGCLLIIFISKKNYKMIAKDLSKQQALDADPRAIQQINFTTI